ncbi:MAG: hypothetical protein MK106_08330 [Mariniblastus sp.]|nr:hypothetical protein [Mariniblastus sp.]
MRLAIPLFLLALAPGLNLGQEPTPELVIKGLNNPTSVAIQPTTGHVFVADSGHFKVVRIIDGKSEDVITDFPTGVYQNGKSYAAAPLSIAFLDQDTLVVGTAESSPSRPKLQLFDIPAAGSEPINSKAATSEASLPDENAQTKQGGFYGIFKSTSALFVAYHRPDQPGWIAKADLATNQLTNLHQEFSVQDVAKANFPFSVVLSPEGFLAVTQVGIPQSGIDSQLAFYDIQGNFLQSFDTGLSRVVGAAYGPQRGRLFAINFTSPDDSGTATPSPNSGLYKIVADGKEKCKPVLIAELNKPSALAFTPTGDLYVTVFGALSEEGEQPSGALMRIKGLDQPPKKK